MTITVCDESRGIVRELCSDCGHDVVLTVNGLVCEHCESNPAPKLKRSFTSRKALWKANSF